MEQEALPDRDPELSQHVEFLLALDPLGNHFDRQALAHVDGGGDQRDPVGRKMDGRDHVSIELDDIDGK